MVVDCASVFIIADVARGMEGECEGSVEEIIRSSDYQIRSGDQIPLLIGLRNENSDYCQITQVDWD
jgi:hypothetical protein